MSVIEFYRSRPGRLVPGLVQALLVAAAAFALQHIPGLHFLSPLIIAAVLGIAWRCIVGVSEAGQAGVAFAAKALLRLAIILLGLQISIGQIVGMGWVGFIVAGFALVSTFCFTLWFGRLIGADPALVELIAAGTSVCGASAIVATNTVTRADDADVAYALGCITLFGTLAVIVYPVLMVILNLAPAEYGLWVGASIHEVAQVVAAGFQGGHEAGDAATIVKLIRVLMLAPLLLALGWFRPGVDAAASASRRVGVPGFVLGFIAMVILNSLVPLPPVMSQGAALLTLGLLTVSLAAIGLMTSFAHVLRRGMKPLAVAAAATLFIAITCLVLSKLFAAAVL
ncbi:MAG TPA: putative sulfate exporter family transporter [Pseudolabrys sp.]|nr:putative sulfate exporter family transporter [Pseudolabrys sp.]